MNEIENFMLIFMTHCLRNTENLMLILMTQCSSVKVAKRGSLAAPVLCLQKPAAPRLKMSEQTTAVPLLPGEKIQTTSEFPMLGQQHFVSSCDR